jgi:MFS family permease
MATNSGRYKWYVLFLVASTGAFALGAPAVSLAVLFPEISRDLSLNLVQMGLLWSIGSLPAIFTSPLVGAIDDRFGPKRVILAGTILVGLAAGSRGLAADFASLFLIIILVGSLVPLVTTSSYKICGIWFPPAQLGLANGVLAAGIALGSLFGSLLSAMVLSPWLGGWRNVLLLYGALSILLCIPWHFTRPAPETTDRNAPAAPAVPMRRALAHIVGLKDVWLLGIALLGIGGCVQGLAGYLPVYLRGQGWDGAAADGALSLLNAMSMVFILPIALWSDRLGARKSILRGMTLMIAAGTGLLSVAVGWIVWAAVILAGMVRDGSTALLMTMVIETDGVGPVYAGSAAGFVIFFFFLGNLLSPPLGNRLADILPGLPFAFWAGLAAGLLSLAAVHAAARKNGGGQADPQMP